MKIRTWTLIWRQSITLVLGILLFVTPVIAAPEADTNTDMNDEDQDEAEEDQDPLEGFNRIFFAFNRVVDGILIKPVTYIYQKVVPEGVRDSVGNVVDNLAEPLVAVNHALQGNMEGMGTSLVRAVVNTTAGAGGIFDPAKTWLAERKDTNLGQTLHVWGIPSGPYVVWPLIGPSDIRDALGRVGDYYADPLRLYIHDHDSGKHEWLTVRTVVKILRTRDEMMRPVGTDELGSFWDQAIDPYSATRSAYVQQRNARLAKLPKLSDRLASTAA